MVESFVLRFLRREVKKEGRWRCDFIREMNYPVPRSTSYNKLNNGFRFN